MNDESQLSGEPDFSLVGRSAMGGIVGGGGFDFQTRYILCRLVEWTSASDFYQMLHEGTGDVDVRFRKDGNEWREHIQVKDHAVTPAEFREVVKNFIGFDREMPAVYGKFVLAAPTLSPQLKTLQTQIQRIRDAAPFYDTVPKVLANTRRNVLKRLESLGLSAYEDFVMNRIEFDINLHDCHDDARAHKVFLGNMVNGGAEIWLKFSTASSHVYDRLFREINSRRQKVLGRADLDGILNQLSNEVLILLPDQAVAIIGIHNWAYEKLDPAPHYEVDWSHRFDRLTKQVPDPEHWNTELVPEFYKIKKEILKEKGSGLIRIAGSGCLSTQVALGLVFRELEGWTIETVQRPANETWRSNATPTPDYDLQIVETQGDPNADAIALLVSVKNDVQSDVEAYLASAGIPLCAIINILPPRGAGSIAIKSDADAVALVTATRDALRTAQDKYGVKTTHLFISGPQAIALFLGQRLTSMGRLQLYEYQDPSYKPSCLLPT